MKKLSGSRISAYKRKLNRYCNAYAPAELETAAQWYMGAQFIAQSIAGANGLSLEQSASIISALSPRKSWSMNIAQAIDFAAGKPVATMRQQLKTADKARQDGFAALNGLKTSAFARNIAGDTESVTVDVWMCKAAGLQTHKPNKTQYREIERACQLLALEMGLQPATLQALIWIRIRGSAE